MARFDLSLPQSSLCDQINEIIVSIFNHARSATILLRFFLGLTLISFYLRHVCFVEIPLRLL